MLNDLRYTGYQSAFDPRWRDESIRRLSAKVANMMRTIDGTSAKVADMAVRFTEGWPTREWWALLRFSGTNDSSIRRVASLARITISTRS